MSRYQDVDKILSYNNININNIVYKLFLHCGKYQPEQ